MFPIPQRLSFLFLIATDSVFIVFGTFCSARFQTDASLWRHRPGGQGISLRRIQQMGGIVSVTSRGDIHGMRNNRGYSERRRSRSSTAMATAVKVLQ
ncbi:hypothetical protein BDW22DRAFT_616274 [Trametopsis cervina]|nr:hypothetical protein BDW22DRAFT_616274 [Trametopsis cervina]